MEILENVDFPLTQLFLQDIVTILPPDFVQQLSIVLVNGNFGDFVAARDALPIIKYLKSCKPSLEIRISTNGSGQPEIWSEMGSLGIEVQFRLDGLSDTHKLYRQNTSWDLIISNAKKFIAAGGKATWAMIFFEHNRHQIEACRQMSEELGFERFLLINNDPGIRNQFPVFTKDRRLSHVVGDYKGPTDFDTIYSLHQKSRENLDQELDYHVDKGPITCKAMTIENDYRGQEIYIAANGDVSPCCWTGFYPAYKTSYSNRQLAHIVKENNALVYGIEHSVQWFNALAETWKIPSVKQGRIKACNDICGHDCQI